MRNGSGTHTNQLLVGGKKKSRLTHAQHTSKDIKQFTFTVSAKKSKAKPKKKKHSEKLSRIANEMKSAAEINHKRGAAEKGANETSPGHCLHVMQCGNRAMKSWKSWKRFLHAQQSRNEKGPAR